mmetsp:Transcript_48236/g.127389  ORF Transcript_48236/g.127389 Transcript_48236/m.127389 type:complete len:249 (+) Transcript_48236:86-832(+)
MVRGYSNGVPCDGWYPMGTKEAAWKAGAIHPQTGLPCGPPAGPQGCDPCEGGGCADMCGLDRESPGEPQNVAWAFVGQGGGAYNKTQTYNYVGVGAGAFEKDEVVIEYGWKVKPHCIGCAVMAAILAAMVLLVGSGTTETASTTNFNITAGLTCLGLPGSLGLTVEQEAQCCELFSLRCVANGTSVTTAAPDLTTVFEEIGPPPVDVVPTEAIPSPPAATEAPVAPMPIEPPVEPSPIEPPAPPSPIV